MNSNNKTLRDEIYNLLKSDWLTQREPMNYRLAMQTQLILRIFKKRIDDKILDIKKDREVKSHDFEGDSNLESQIEMLEEWKEEIF